MRNDHSALQWLMSFREPEGQLACWIEKQQVQYFTMVHRPDIQHDNADVLSHQKCATDECHYCRKSEAKCTALRIEKTSDNQGLTSVDSAELMCKQGEDGDLTPVLQWVSEQRYVAWEESGLCS